MIEKLEQVDDILASYENWMHGTDGENCTKARKILIEVMKEVKNISFNPVLADSKNLCEWVSVAERLPECGHYIATYFNPSDKNKKKYVVPLWRGRNGWYWDNAEKEKAEDKTLKVTHWMKFPKPSVRQELGCESLLFANVATVKRSEI